MSKERIIIPRIGLLYEENDEYKIYIHLVRKSRSCFDFNNDKKLAVVTSNKFDICISANKNEKNAKKMVERMPDIEEDLLIMELSDNLKVLQAVYEREIEDDD